MLNAGWAWGRFVAPIVDFTPCLRYQANVGENMQGFLKTKAKLSESGQVDAAEIDSSNCSEAVVIVEKKCYQTFWELC